MQKRNLSVSSLLLHLFNAHLLRFYLRRPSAFYPRNRRRQRRPLPAGDEGSTGTCVGQMYPDHKQGLTRAVVKGMERRLWDCLHGSRWSRWTCPWWVCCANWRPKSCCTAEWYLLTLLKLTYSLLTRVRGSYYILKYSFYYSNIYFFRSPCLNIGGDFQAL